VPMVKQVVGLEGRKRKVEQGAQGHDADEYSSSESILHMPFRQLRACWLPPRGFGSWFRFVHCFRFSL